MPLRFSSFILSGLLLFVTQPTSLHAQEDSPRLPLWEVRQVDGPTVYLMGSVHLLRPEVYPLNEALYRVFDSVSLVAFEVDFTELASAGVELAQRGMLPHGERLADILEADRYAELMKRSAEYGIPGQIVDRMRPWMASLTLSTMVIQAGGYEVAAGIDRHFHERGQARGMTIIALETLGEQLDVFDGLDREVQVAMLVSTLDDLDETVTMLDRATRYWESGNATGLATMFRDAMADNDVLRDRLLYQRNRNWIPQIEALLEGSEDAIVIVGMGHLVGEGSVIELLDERGYVVTQHAVEAVLVD